MTGHADVIANIECSDKAIDVNEFNENAGMVSKKTQNQLAETTVELKKIRKKLTSTQKELAVTRKELQVRLRLGAREVTVEGYGQGQDCDMG